MELQNIIKHSLSQYGIHTKKSFCSILPVGLRRHTFFHITDPPNIEHYSVTPKLDGVRKLLCILQEGMYFLDRRNRVEMLSTTGSTTTSSSTILDGEYIDNCFVVFDMIIYNGEDIREQSFKRRYECMLTFVNIYQEEKKYTDVLKVFPKTIYPLTKIDSVLLTVPNDKGIYSVTSTTIIPTCYTSFPYTTEFKVDGLIFMDDRATYNSTSGLYKWKDVATIDVMMFVSDLQNLQPNKNMVQTWYWEYNTYMQRSYQTKFKMCFIKQSMKESMLKHTLHVVSKSIMICVECMFDRKTHQWIILKHRPLKKRSNSSRTVHETLRIIHEQLSYAELCLLCKNTNIKDDKNIVEIETQLSIFCNKLTWLGCAWSTDHHFELELRLLCNKIPHVPPHMFETVLLRLQSNKHFIYKYHETTDYLSGECRATYIDTSNTPQIVLKKERIFSKDIYIDKSMFGIRCCLSIEHTCTNNYNKKRYMSRRRKKRHRFIYRNSISIDLTKVYNNDDKTPTYEIEMELLHDHLNMNISHQISLKRIQSMYYHMLWFVCRKRKETVRFNEE
jgi:hypothetical protein